MRAISMALALCLLASVPLGCGKKDGKMREASARVKQAGAGTTTGDRAPPPGLGSDWADGGGPAVPGPAPIAPSSPRSSKPESVAEAAPMKTPPPAIAEAVTGVVRNPARTPKQPELQSGLLTAGSFDDNLDPLVFRSFVKKLGQLSVLGDLPAKLGGDRLLILVKDAAGKPVGNARVRLSANGKAGAELVTRSDGRAIFVLSWDQLPPGETLTANVSSPD